MGVLAENAAREFVGMSLADHLRAAFDQDLHRRSRALRRRMRPQPIRIAGAGNVPLDVEQVLGGKSQSRERSGRRTGEVSAGVATERIQRIVHSRCHSRATAFTAASLVGKLASSPTVIGFTGGRR